MTLANFQNYIYRRTKTNSSSWGTSGADMVIALNNANEHVLSLIRGRSDNFYPTAWTTTDLSTGTATPVFDALFHELVSLWVVYDYAVENGLTSADRFERKITRLESQLILFYGTRNYKIFTVTIASPGVLTRKDNKLIVGDRVIFSTTGALPTGLSASTWYYVVSGSSTSTSDDFTVSATKNGTAINTSGTQSGTHYFATDTQSGMRAGRDSNR